MDNYQILASTWISTARGLLGIVAILTSTHEPSLGEWRAYIGNASGIDQEADEQNVAANGGKLDPWQAIAFFPGLDITKYKEYIPASSRALERLAELDAQAEDYGELRMVQLSEEDVILLRNAIAN